MEFSSSIGALGRKHTKFKRDRVFAQTRQAGLPIRLRCTGPTTVSRWCGLPPLFLNIPPQGRDFIRPLLCGGPYLLYALIRTTHRTVISFAWEPNTRQPLSILRHKSKTTSIMFHRRGGSTRSSEHALLFSVQDLDRADSRLDPAKESTPEGPISKYLVTHELGLDDLVKGIRKLLASKEQQEGAKNLEPGDALKFVELLDQVCSLRSSSQSPPP